MRGNSGKLTVTRAASALHLHASEPHRESENVRPLVNMALNESPFGPSPRVLEAIRKAALKSNFYPDDLQSELRERLAEDAGLKPDEVLITAGAAAFLSIVADALLSRGSNAVTSERSYIFYRAIVDAAGAELIQVPMRDDAFDLDAILDALTPRTRLIFIANPNNPTGTMLEPAVIERFLDRLPEQITVVLDEAYSDFAEHFARERRVEYSRSFDYVREGRNVIVVRTFSKARSLAGLRIGYGFAPARLTRSFARTRMQYSVTNLATAGAIAALGDPWHIQKTLRNNSREGTRLAERLRKLGLCVKPTWANFLYLETGEDADALAARIERGGVLVRSLNPWGAPHAIRVTISSPENNKRFLTALYNARLFHDKLIGGEKIWP